MSHFTTLKTRFVAKAPLLAAIADVAAEFGLGRVRENAVVSGYSGNTTPADVVVATHNANYDLGFRMSGETYELVADWWGIRDIEKEALTQRLQQRYAYHSVREQLDQNRFTLVEEEVDVDQTIRLVVRRVS